MSGHSKWSKVKHQKSLSDAKKGKIFSKIARLIAVAAKKGTDPNSNSSLRDAINQAKSINMPAENIERAIKKSEGGLQSETLQEVRYEAFGPGGTAIIIEGITDNKNRTSNEIKHILSKYNAKLAEPNSVLWVFEKKQPNHWQSMNAVQISEIDKERLKKLIENMEEHDDVQKIYTNADYS